MILPALTGARGVPGRLLRVPHGSLYPSLRRLEKEGAVESVPSDEERGGRRKNVYRVTEKGEKLLSRSRRRRTTTPPRTHGSVCASGSSSTCLRRRASACWNGVGRSWRIVCARSGTRCGPRVRGSTTTRSRWSTGAGPPSPTSRGSMAWSRRSVAAAMKLTQCLIASQEGARVMSRCVWRSWAWATAPRRWCRASSTTRRRTPTIACPV